MTALRSIIKCVESCNLESRFNTNELKRRLARLEKAKADRKKPAVPKKFRSKRPMPIGGTGTAPTFPAKAARTSNEPFASFSQNSTAASHIPPVHNAYGFPGQGRPDGLASAPYATTGRSQSPSTATQWYYMDDDIVGRVPYGGSAISYGGHDYPSVTLGQPSYPHWSSLVCLLTAVVKHVPWLQYFCCTRSCWGEWFIVVEKQRFRIALWNCSPKLYKVVCLCMISFILILII